MRIYKHKDGYGVIWILVVLACLSIFLSLLSYINYHSLSHECEELKGEVRWLKSLLPFVINNTPSSLGREGIIYRERSIPIVAVSSDGGGEVGTLTLKIIPGNNNVLINTNPFVEPDIQYSVNKAVAFAKLYTHYRGRNDFIFTYHMQGAQLVGGGSAGAATAIVTIAALENKTLRNDSVITGTINLDGSIGKVGGVVEKAMAVAKAGYKYFLIPKGQAKITYYEKVVKKENVGWGFYIYNTYYVPKTIDLKEVAKKEWNLTIVEVSNIEEALPYFMN